MNQFNSFWGFFSAKQCRNFSKNCFFKNYANFLTHYKLTVLWGRQTEMDVKILNLNFFPLKFSLKFVQPPFKQDQYYDHFTLLVLTYPIKDIKYKNNIIIKIQVIYSAHRLIWSRIIESAAYCIQILLVRLYPNSTQKGRLNWISQVLLPLLCWPKVILLCGGHYIINKFRNNLVIFMTKSILQDCDFVEVERKHF